MTTIEHFLYAPTEAQARAMAAELQTSSGLPVGGVRPAVSGTDWLVMAYTGEQFNPDAFAGLAARHGGHYDGWDSYVGPLPTLAPPPPVERTWSAEGWSGREIAITFGVIFALVPILAIIERATDASAGVLAVVYWAVMGASYAAMRPDTKSDLGAVLFAVYITAALQAIEATADVLGVWQGWVALAAVGPIIAIHWLPGHPRSKTPEDR